MNQYAHDLRYTKLQYAAGYLTRPDLQKSVAGLFCSQPCMLGKLNTFSFKALKDGYRSKDSFPNISSKFSSDTANTKSVHVSWNKKRNYFYNSNVNYLTLCTITSLVFRNLLFLVACMCLIEYAIIMFLFLNWHHCNWPVKYLTKFCHVRYLILSLHPSWIQIFS